MRNKKYKKDDTLKDTADVLWDLGYRLSIIYFFILFMIFLGDKAKFWKLFNYTIFIILFLLIVLFLFKKIKKYFNKKRLNSLIQDLKSKNQEEYLINFINRFGFEGGKNYSWKFRNYSFSFDRINDLKKILKENNIIKKDKDVFWLLKFYINKKEEELTRGSIEKRVQKFSILSGEDFEKLLYRLFSAMGYKVQLVGKRGDQGGDLIAIKDDERILIQAKRYNNWYTGNKAVQEVVAAMKYYDCNKAIVVTTSYFTSEAIDLAKVNNVILISKNQLQEWLLKYLGENWV